MRSEGEIRSWRAVHWNDNTSTECLDLWMSVGWNRIAVCCVNEHGLRQGRNKVHCPN